MLKTLIVDDEEKARVNLQSLLNEYCENVEVVAMAGSIADAIKMIDEKTPDLVFLDVKMHGETGFDLLEQMNDFDFDIIFITAFDEYAFKAFKFSALDYLLKPINIDELIVAVNKANEQKSVRNAKQQMDMVIDNIRSTGNKFRKIALPTLDGLLFIELDEIIRCESAENYTNFYLKSGKKILVSKTIKYFEELLSDHNFFRVHRSHLINLDHIEKYVKGEGGYAIMSDESSVLISRRKKEPFLRQFAKA